jgi:DNA invertase Pin-like site-specific DNA recombinase
MKANYIRISDKSQKTHVQQNDSDRLYIDFITGMSKFSSRPKAKELMQDIESGQIAQVTVQDISRLGRNLIDIITTLEWMHSKGVVIYVQNLGLYSMEDGKESSTFKMVISTFVNFAEMELATLRVRQANSVKDALSRGVYRGD